MTSGVGVARAVAIARQPELKRRSIGQSVSVSCADLHDAPSSWIVLVDDRSVDVGKFRVIVVDIDQVNNNCSGSRLGRISWKKTQHKHLCQKH